METQEKERVSTETIEVKGDDLLGRIRELVHEGNVRRIIIKNEDDQRLLEIPLTLGVVSAMAASPRRLQPALSGDAGNLPAGSPCVGQLAPFAKDARLRFAIEPSTVALAFRRQGSDRRMLSRSGPRPGRCRFGTCQAAGSSRIEPSPSQSVTSPRSIVIAVPSQRHPPSLARRKTPNAKR